MTKLEEVVEKLLEKAAKAETSQEALHYTQAALNAANTKHALTDLHYPK